MEGTNSIYNSKNSWTVKQLDILKNMENVPDELKQLRRWVCHKNKLPYNPTTGDPAKADDPSTWSAYDTCVQAHLSGEYHGIGCELAPPFICVDFDHCVDTVTNVIEPWVEELIDSLDSYTEVSPSGTGYHTWVKGIKPPDGCRVGRFEMYQTGRYMTVTGWRDFSTSGAIEDRSELIASIHADKFAARLAVRPSSDTALAPYSCILSADEILTHLFAEPAGAKWSDIYAGLWQAHYSSPSDAELALLMKLAFYTGRDAAMMETIFLESPLSGILIRGTVAKPTRWKIPKWISRPQYRQKTLDAAISRTHSVYTPSSSEQVKSYYRKKGKRSVVTK